MSTTSDFLSRLKKEVMTFESEIKRLQSGEEAKNNNAGEALEINGNCTRDGHELTDDATTLKTKIEDLLAVQKAQQDATRKFLEACKQRQADVRKELESLRTRMGLCSSLLADDEEAAAEDEDVEEASRSSSQTSTPPSYDAMRTPQLADFGLSELELKKVLSGPEAPAVPDLNLPPPPKIKKFQTPKCTLRMDEEDLQMPNIHDFGISEHTMCLNNDFTMDLFRKNVSNPQRASQETAEVLESVETNVEDLVSPVPPVLCTTGLKIKKPNIQINVLPASPPPSTLPATPQLPAFQTPYANRLASGKKVESAVAGSANSLRTGFKRSWEQTQPSVSDFSLDEKQMPELPNLESALGNSLQKKMSKYQKRGEAETDEQSEEATQEFSLRSPRISSYYQNCRTPEMPHLSSPTQDIYKTQKKPAPSENFQLRTKPEESKRSRVCEVSEHEFQSLPSYLRTMDLSSLNLVVRKFNAHLQENRGQIQNLEAEPLRRIMNVGKSAPIYIVCLKELNRLQDAGGASNSKLYKLVTST